MLPDGLYDDTDPDYKCINASHEEFPKYAGGFAAFLCLLGLAIGYKVGSG